MDKNYKINRLHIKKDDTVMVLWGKDKGKMGKVLRVFPKDRKVIVSGVNIVKRHQRPTRQYQHGGIIEKEGAIYVDKLMLVCPKCNQPTRTGKKNVGDKRVRYCKKCQEIVDNV